MAEPHDSGLPAKLYFRIGEVAELVGVEPHVLRYWEREFRAIRPSKSSRGQRVYSRRDVETLMRVRRLLYEEGFTIAGAKRKLQHRDEVASHETSAGIEAPDTARAELLGRGDENDVPKPPPIETVADVGGARGHLLALREELVAFLAELDPERA